MTDETNIFSGPKVPSGKRTIAGMTRHMVNHGSGEYVRGNVHTNTAEGFVSLLKRGIVGTFHHVGKGHLGRYVSEFEFRYNIRHLADKDRPVVLVAGAEGKRLTYKQQRERARIERELYRGRKWRAPRKQSGGRQGPRTPRRVETRIRRRDHPPPVHELPFEDP